MHIFQPRLENISISEISVDELTEWAETELKEKVYACGQRRAKLALLHKQKVAVL
jgi:hypothetical protein